MANTQADILFAEAGYELFTNKNDLRPGEYICYESEDTHIGFSENGNCINISTLYGHPAPLTPKDVLAISCKQQEIVTFLKNK